MKDNYKRFTKLLLEKKKELSQSTGIYLKIKYPFEKNPILLWWCFPSVIYKYILRNIISICPPCSLQVMLLKLLGVKIGKNVGISVGFKVDPWFPDLIEIEDNVIIGENVIFLTHDITKSRTKLGKIIVKKNALISAHSIIGAGVVIAQNTKIALGSIITENTLGGTLYRGYFHGC